MIVLVSNEPRAYREAITGTLEVLRPRYEVLKVEPEDLDEEVLRLGPHLVVCSRATEVVEKNTPAWIELYPSHTRGAVVCLAGEHDTFVEMDFETLLSTIDRAGLLYQPA